MEQLIKRARAGDGAAFVELIEGQKGTLYKVARSYLHNDADAADAISETVLACFEKLPSLRQAQYFRTWLVRILIRKCQDMLRERKRSVPLDEITEMGQDEPGHARVEFLALLDCPDMTGRNVTQADLKHYLTQVLFQAAALRDKASSSQYGTLLGQAVAYIDSHFTDDNLSLNLVAREINISANYLSAVFSQEMGVTFTEYVTGRRMEKARELLRTTDKRSGEVAAAVGYRDPHYFSFLFKKTQGCTPRDYRAGGVRKP